MTTGVVHSPHLPQPCINPLTVDRDCVGDCTAAIGRGARNLPERLPQDLRDHGRALGHGDGVLRRRGGARAMHGVRRRDNANAARAPSIVQLRVREEHANQTTRIASGRGAHATPGVIQARDLR